jgi:hypothetical protein
MTLVGETTDGDNSAITPKRKAPRAAAPTEKARKKRKEDKQALDTPRAEAEEEHQRREEAAARAQSEAATREREGLEQGELERQKRIADDARQRRHRSDQVRERRRTEQQRRSRSREQQDNRLLNAHSDMTAARAIEILGIGAGATDEEVRAAYGRLMKRVHPDLGGSAFFATQLNIARDTLLEARFVATSMRASPSPPRRLLASPKTKTAIVVFTVLSLVAFVCACVMVLQD